MLDNNVRYLQLAFNDSRQDVERILPLIPPSPRILIEAGTPYIKQEGGWGIRAIRERWGGLIVADLKIADGAHCELAMARRSGANAATALGNAPTETLDLFVTHCRQMGLMSMIDMIGVKDPLKVLRPMKSPPAAVVMHRGRDEENTRGKMIQYRHVNRIRSKYDVHISAAGGIDLRESRSAIFNGASIVVVNFVQPGSLWTGISTSSDIPATVQKYLDMIA